MTSIAPEVTFPDAEILLQGWIRGFDATWRVVTDLPSQLTGVVVQVTRIGGSALYAALLDRPRMDIDVYAATRGAAQTAARTIQAKLPTIRNVSAGGGVVTGLLEEQGPSWRPDFNTNIRRVGMTYRFTVRPV